MKKSYKVFSFIIGILFIIGICFAGATSTILVKGLPFYGENDASNFYYNIRSMTFNSPLCYESFLDAVEASASFTEVKMPIVVPNVPVAVATLEDSDILIYGAVELTYEKGIKNNLTTKQTDIKRLSSDSVILNERYHSKYKIGDKITLNYDGKTIIRTVDGFIVNNFAFPDNIDFTAKEYSIGTIAMAIIPYNDVFADKEGEQYSIDGSIFYDEGNYNRQKAKQFIDYLGTKYGCTISEDAPISSTMILLTEGSRHYSEKEAASLFNTIIIFLIIIYSIFTILTDKKSPLFSLIKSVVLIALCFALAGIFYAVLKNGIFFMFAGEIFLTALYSLFILITPSVVFLMKTIKASKKKNSVEGRINDEKENN